MPPADWRYDMHWNAAGSLQARMNRSCCRVASILQAGIGLAISAFGQSLVEPERIPHVRQLFATAASAPQLRCEISPVLPALTFGFRFQAGYKLDISLDQFRGSAHALSVHTRVTPQGRAPVYLTKTEMLPDFPEAKVGAVTGGTFVVGDGAYGVELLVEDDLHRSCRGSWQIQARRTGSERQLKPATPPATVEELSVGGPPLADVRFGPRASRLTVMVHAAPLSPNLSALDADDIQRLVDSLSSLLREFPAQRVRLIAFNLDQRAIVFRQDGFDANHMGELTAALRQFELWLVDYKVLRERPEPMDLLLGLVQAELRDPQPPDALIVLGPGTRMHDDVPVDALGQRPAAGPPIFDLQFQSNQPLRPSLRSPQRGGLAAARRLPDPLSAADGSVPPAPIPSAADTIERLVSRLKGQMIPVRTPHDLADAIQRMDPRIPKTGAPAAVAAKAEAPAQKATPQPAADPATSRPPQAADSTGDEDPVKVLVRLRDRVVEHGERIPNHTCVEMIQRDRYEPAAGRAPKSCDTLLGRRKQGDFQARLKLDSTDWLRLDVASTSTGREIYSWAAASKFEEGEIDELVPEGAVGTGPFTGFLLSIFEPRGPRYSFDGEAPVDGRRLFEYSYAVPREQSHYRVKAHKEWLITGYSGTLLVDPKTAELVRLVVRTEELSPATSLCETDTSLEYGVVQLGAGGYLLPKITRQRFIGREGAEAENTISFAACREYQAESKVAFGEGARTGATKASIPAAASELPAGLPVTVELITVVRIGQAAAGDQIEGRLAKPIRDERQRTLVAEGSAVQGRLMRVETVYSPRLGHTVALRWETVRIGGAMAPLSLLPIRRPANPGPGGSSVLRRRGMEIELPLPSESRYGVFHLPAKRAVLESGFPSEWVTARPQ